MRILITGGAGFIGLNFVNFCLKKKIKPIVIDKLSYASNKKEIIDLKKRKKIFFIKASISDNIIVSKILKNYKIDKIINFAAETHVDNSIKRPIDFVKENVLNFSYLLENVKKYLDKNKLKKFIFLHVSTDEVYGSLKIGERSFGEKNKYYPNSPYAASKAASDLLARAWYKTYDLPIIITNCSNNYGIFQNKEKLIPKIIINAINQKKIPIYGNGKNIRDWIHVDDHCRALWLLLKQGKVGETYNIGSNSEMNNLYLAKNILKYLDKFYPSTKIKTYSYLTNFVKDRKAHDFRYSVNSKKIKKLGWLPKNNFKKSIGKIINFYQNFFYN
jgi:dTDP-glucose 4,6-dehydratase